MKTLIFALATASIALTVPTLASAKHHAMMHHAAMKHGAAMTHGDTVVERDAHGRPSKVNHEGAVVDVCNEMKKDSCVNPREAGLNFGNNPVQNWPGKPASEMKH